MNEIESLRNLYLDSIRLYLWYTGSPYSFHQGKTNKAQAEQAKYMAHYHLSEYKKLLRKMLDS